MNATLIDEETRSSNRDGVEQLGTEICALAGQIAAATARFLTLLAKFDEDRGWTGPGLHSCAHWLSWKCGMSLHTGREYVRVAKALRSLPEMRKAFEQGRLSYSKVRALTRVTTPSNEKQMVRFGCEAPAAQIDRLAAGLRKATDNESGKNQSARTSSSPLALGLGYGRVRHQRTPACAGRRPNPRSVSSGRT